MRLWFGKYRENTVFSVWRDDPSYIHWLYDQEWIPDHLRLELKAVMTAAAAAHTLEAIDSRAVNAIIGKITEALTHRGYTTNEATIMVNKLIEYGGTLVPIER